MPSAFTQGILATPLPVALGGTGLSSLGTSLQVVRVNAGATALEYATIGALTDGDKGDITVSSSGTVWVIDNSAVTLAKIANIATASILGRNTAGTGVIEELSASTTKTLLSLDNVDNVSLLSWNGSTNIDTLGLITTGTWQADPIGVAYGGTGITSISALSVWVANSANTITEVTPTAGQSIRINAGATAWEAYTPGSGGGDVTKVGTPVNNQIGVWTGDGTIEGTTGLTYDGSNFLLTGDIGATGTRVTKGWFTDLQVTNAIAGSVTGNAATVTTNANLTGVVTSTGNATAIADNALSIAKTSGLQTALDGNKQLLLLEQVYKQH